MNMNISAFKQISEVFILHDALFNNFHYEQYNIYSGMLLCDSKFPTFNGCINPDSPNPRRQLSGIIKETIISLYIIALHAHFVGDVGEFAAYNS